MNPGPRPHLDDRATLGADADPRAAVHLAVEPAQIADAEVDRVVATAPPWSRAADELGSEIQIVDPWLAEGGETLPRYELARRGCHGEVDLAPHDAPVHPWVAPSAGGVSSAAAESRLRAAAAGLAGLHSTRLVLGDERVRLTNERLYLLAGVVSSALKGRKSLIELELRVWPEDLRADRVVDHLSLLPVAALDLLVGSLHAPSLTRMGAALSADEIAELARAISAAGLGHLTTLSVVAGLPGETIEQSIAALDRTLKLAAANRLPAVRCSLWLGGGPPPRDPEDQKRRFLASHPEWTEEEYRGFHDLVAVIRGVAPNINIVGPGFLPGWDSVP